VAPHAEGQLIYTYFHFAAAEKLTRAVIDSGCIAVAYETVQLPSGELPCSRDVGVAGRMAVQQGAKYLEKILRRQRRAPRRRAGRRPGEVVIIGGGVVGTNAARWPGPWRGT